jgi:hypothetical protein
MLLIVVVQGGFVVGFGGNMKACVRMYSCDLEEEAYYCLKEDRWYFHF